MIRMNNGTFRSSLAAVTALDDPARLALYEFVAGRDEPTSRDDAAAALGLSRSTAAFQLDRLADDGLLSVEFRRLSGKTGPGAGRPAKLYRRAPTEVSVSVPARQYELAGDLMAQAIDESAHTGEPATVALGRIARDRGHSMGAAAGEFVAALEQGGYEPREDPAGGLVMGNCPFHRLSEKHRDTVCTLNFELVSGIAEGVAGCDCTVNSEPGAGRCCVRAVSAAEAGGRPTGPSATDQGGDKNPRTNSQTTLS